MRNAFIIFYILVCVFIVSPNKTLANSVNTSTASIPQIYGVSFSTGDIIQFHAYSTRSNCTTRVEEELIYKLSYEGSSTTEYLGSTVSNNTAHKCNVIGLYSVLATQSGTASIRMNDNTGLRDSGRVQIVVISAPDGGGTVATSTIRGMFSVSSPSNLLTYNSSTGVFTTDNTTYWNGDIKQTSISTTTIRGMFSANSPIQYTESLGEFDLDYSGLIIDSDNIGDISDYVYGLFTGTDPIVYDGNGDFSCPTCSEGGSGSTINGSNPYNAHLETYQTLLFVLISSFLLVLGIKFLRKLTNKKSTRGRV